MINAEKLSYSFPQKDLYDEISFTIEDGQHCAFIGASGSGKTTLVDMIMNPYKYLYDGKLEIEPDCKIGYTSQFYIHDKSQTQTVYDYIAEEFIIIQEKLAAICVEMETATDLEPLLERYQKTLDAFDAVGGDDFESYINKKLNLANLMGHKELSVSQLSGGEFKLIQVIREMLRNPDLMIMDEPDVFLDFENLNSLKNIINAHKGTMLVITHSRYLLNHCFNNIIHLENMALQQFEGRYIDYNFALLESKIEIQELAVADTDEINRNEILIEKLRDIATNTAESARGRSLNARVKIQARLVERRIQEPFVYIKQPNISLLADNVVADDMILTVKDYSVSFEDVLLQKVSFEIKANEKVAIIGPNGTGKTTLLRSIYKNNNPAIKLGESAQMAYLSQVQGEMMNESNTLMDEFFDYGFPTGTEIIEYLGSYGFAEEMLHQKISTLSGGEKNILQLAKFSSMKTNLLLLDEPSSHLDTYAQLALEKAIREYEGAILMVSHDFYSIVNCVDFVLIIDDKTIRRMSIRKFRKMIYASHFDRGYLELEQKKKAVQVEIALALQEKNFILAKTLCEDLGKLIQLI